MKIICNKSALLTGVNTVLKEVPARTTMPILECILIDTTSGVIKLTANDMDLGIETTIDGDVLDKGCIALEAKLFSEIIRKLPDSEVTIETDSNNKALIKCEKAKFNIAGKDGEDFVALPEIEKNHCRLIRINCVSYLWTDRESLSVKLHLKNLMIRSKQLFLEKH